MFSMVFRYMSHLEFSHANRHVMQCVTVVHYLFSTTLLLATDRRPPLVKQIVSQAVNPTLLPPAFITNCRYLSIRSAISRGTSTQSASTVSPRRASSSRTWPEAPTSSMRTSRRRHLDLNSPMATFNCDMRISFRSSRLLVLVL